MYDKNKYKTKFIEQHEEQLRMEKERQEDAKWKMQKKAHKMDNYAKIVKEMHWPEISERKRSEVDKHKKEIENRNKKLWSPSTKRERSNSAEHKEYKGPDWKGMVNTMKPMSSKEEKQIEKTDYLEKKRIQREQIE